MPLATTEMHPQAMKARMLAGSAIGAAVLILITRLECGGGWIPSTLYGATFWLWWTGVIYALWRLGKHWPLLLTLSLRAAALQVPTGIALAFAHRFGLYLTVRFMIRTWPVVAHDYGNLTFFDLWHLGIEMLLYGAVWFACCASYAQLLARRSLELEKELADAHLLALQMQIEPHFLLNTLNSLTALIELDRKREALQTLQRLNTILKMTLKRNAPGKIPLTQELEIVKSYLEIEQMRFADRLQIDMKIDPNTLDALVPSFILQPIIENAVRHGIAECENAGRIETSVTRDGQRVRLRVHDSGNGARAGSHAGFGIGLSNTTDRLAHFYRNDYDFGIRRPDSGGFEVLISIPYERKECEA